MGKELRTVSGQIVCAVDPGKTTGIAIGILPDERGPGWKRAVRSALSVGLDGMRGVATADDGGSLSGLVGMQVTGPPEVQAEKIVRMLSRVDEYVAGLGMTEEEVPLVLAIERFILYSGGRLKGSAGSEEESLGGGGQLVAVEVAWCAIGALRASGFEFDVRWENASAAMSTVRDDGLREEGIWWKGREHARDAARHWALYGSKFIKSDEALARIGARKGSL